ncbi:MAG: 30S ribosomal protein S12 methylthiotransferase RimO [Clostridia bacterium]|nr:30S ribosomal protein S12 methylthiotransferase RimO [Clostridia bacterium]
MSKKVAVVSLGCDKNRIDTEHMLANLISSGYEIIDDFDDASVIIINTCAFIESARSEAVDTILDMARKKRRKCEKLIVTGCLSQKYSEELIKELPEVDAFLGVNDYDKIADVLNETCEKRPVFIDGRERVFDQERVVTTPAHYAYLSIADGCDNFCTFCTIPSIRGKYRSRTLESISAEAKRLVDEGVREIILVAQDVTRYGIDIYGRYALIDLIKELTKLDILWIRLMYCYPELVSDKLLDEIATNDKVAKYIDIPMQHYDDGILKLMNRRSGSDMLEGLIEKTKQRKIAVRTTFMVGFPTETESEFEKLCDFVRRADIENVGIFAYSTEEDTPSAKLKPRVSKMVKIKRVKALGKIHLENVRKRNSLLIGEIIDVLYEDIDYDRNMFVGRTQKNAPVVDSVVYFKANFVDVGSVYKVKVTGYEDYDLIGEVVSEYSN